MEAGHAEEALWTFERGAIPVRRDSGGLRRCFAGRRARPRRDRPRCRNGIVREQELPSASLKKAASGSTAKLLEPAASDRCMNKRREIRCRCPPGQKIPALLTIVRVGCTHHSPDDTPGSLPLKAARGRPESACTARSNCFPQKKCTGLHFAEKSRCENFLQQHGR